MFLQRRVCPAIACWVVLAGPAVAADAQAPKTPSAAISAPSWTGFYFGVHSSYGRKHNDFYSVATTAPLTFIGGIWSQGALLGAQAGYNWQYGRNVAGLEIDFSTSRITGTSDPDLVPLGGGTAATITIADDVKHLGTARARLGFLPFSNVLLYGTAGLAWERVNQIATLVTLSPAASQIQVGTRPNDWFGWAAGVGAEFMFGSSSWIGRIEYLHYDFDRVVLASSFATPTQAAADNVKKQTIDVGRVALSYKLSDPATAPGVGFVKAQPTAQAPSWAGTYFGVHGGYGWQRNDFSLATSVFRPDTLGGISARGKLVGVQGGHNWQFGNIVGGVELDFSASGIMGNASPVVISDPGFLFQTETMADEVRYLGTARTRLGFSPAPNIHLYGTTGLAWQRVDQVRTFYLDDPVSTTSRVSKQPNDWFGWAAGVGVEAMLGSPNLIGRVEYLHYDFGIVQPTTVIVATTPNTTRVDRAGRQIVELSRIGLSYKFGDPPVPAGAGGMITKTPPDSAGSSSWSGFYLGMHAGYGRQRNDFSQQFTDAPPTTFEGITSTGRLVGGQAGYNWQHGKVVTGLELDFAATNISGTTSARIDPAPGSSTAGTMTDDVKYLGTTRWRFGLLPIANVLLYGTAGLAWERVEQITTTVQVNAPATGTQMTTLPKDWFGWAAGLGAEFLLGSSNWFGRVEYLHYDFGSVQPALTVTQTLPARFSVSTAGRQTIDMARVAVSYRISP